MSEGKNLSLQRCSSLKGSPSGRKQRENDREHVAEKLQRRLPKFNVFSQNGVFGRDRSLSKNLSVDFKRTNLILDLSFLLIPHDSQIKLRLKIEPKIGSRSEHIAKPKSHLSRDTALLLDDFVDAWSRNVQSQCQFISVQVKRHHKLFSKNLARMNWFQSSHVSSLNDNP